jgi:cysteine/glycine-rich protein
MDTGRCGDIPSSNIPAVAQAYIAPMLSSYDTEMFEGGYTGGDFCPRCSKQVFIAEKRQAGGKSYHMSCFTCLLCSKKLDSSILTEKDGDIFCKACYGRNFAPKGYGYGIGAGTLHMS